MGIKITKFRRFSKNSLQGFCNILMTNIGLEIRDATYHVSDKGCWIGLPAKPYQDENGATKYSYIIKFVDKTKYEQFQKAAIEALDKYRVDQGMEPRDGDIPF